MMQVQMLVKPHHILRGDRILYANAVLIVNKIEAAGWGDYRKFTVTYEGSGTVVCYYYHANDTIKLLSI